MSRRGSGWGAGRWAVVVAIVASSVACGDGGGAELAAPGGEGRQAADSSPFVVGEVLPGYRPVIAGRGAGRQQWGEDSTGTDEPFTVLSSDGTADADEVVVVSITGFEGYQGGLSQAARGYLTGHEEFEVGGRAAIFTPADGEGWADLVADQGGDLAVRVTAPASTRDELLEVLDRVTVESDRGRAPIVEGRPRGLELVGSVDADGVVAMHPYVMSNTDWVPGLERSHAAGWVATADPTASQLSVIALPEGSVDLPALALHHVFDRTPG